MSRKKAAAVLVQILAGSILVSPSIAQTSNQPPINASGAGMSSAQLEATRPVLSAAKSIEDLQQSVDEIKDKSKQMLDLCTKETPIADSDGGSFYGAAQVVQGPYSHTEGKYYVAPKWKLLQLKTDIDKQRSYIAMAISANQQDHRTLRASDACRAKIDGLKAEARQLSVQMTQDADQLDAILAAGADQTQVTQTAKNLIKSTEAVEKKLKEMDKVLKKEIKD